jgi:multidrug efflux system membrane fusion protein
MSRFIGFNRFSSLSSRLFFSIVQRSGDRGSMLSNNMQGVVVLFLFLISLLLLAGCDRSSQKPGAAPPQMPPPPVKIVQPLQKEVVEWDEYSGHIEAMETVEVRARVDGYLTKINFKDGDRVKKGDLLFVIDPRPYQAELSRAEGESHRVQTRLELARNDLERAERLRRAKAMSEEEYDTRSKGLKEAMASLRSAEAAVQAARLNLEFTELRSPINGQIGRELMTVGNLVKADTTLLTTIVSIHPVYVYIDADERAVLKYRRLAEAGQRASARETRIKAELALIDENDFPHQGYIDYVEPRMDAGTGTLRARGVFPNPRNFLSPGFFARVRIPGSAPYQALLLPERALGTDQDQRFIWIVKEDRSVEYRKIKPGAKIGPLRVIAEGLASGEWVVIEGIQKIRPGITVQPERIPMVEAG